MNAAIANDDDALSLSDAELLVAEIRRLENKVEGLEARCKELEQLAHRDTLVDLPNRRSFLAMLQQLIARVERYDDAAAMLFVDLDGLKRINDKYGHGAGDAALIQVAQLLVAVVRSSDCVARLGGDEFAILLEHADELTAWRTALRVVEAVTSTSFAVDDAKVPLSVAVGVAAIRAGDDQQSVMDRADKQMYHVKAM